MKTNFLFIILMMGTLLYSCAQEDEVKPVSISNDPLIIKSAGPNINNIKSSSSACQQAFEGKCFRGSEVDLSNITTMLQVEGFCNVNPNFCSAEECMKRISIIRGLSQPTQGPCI